MLTAVDEVLAALPMADDASERLAIDEPVTRVLAWMRTRLGHSCDFQGTKRVGGKDEKKDEKDSINSKILLFDQSNCVFKVQPLEW